MKSPLTTNELVIKFVHQSTPEMEVRRPLIDPKLPFPQILTAHLFGSKIVFIIADKNHQLTAASCYLTPRQIRDMPQAIWDCYNKLLEDERVSQEYMPTFPVIDGLDKELYKFACSIAHDCFDHGAITQERFKELSESEYNNAVTI